MKKFFTLFLIFVLFPAIQTMAGGTYHLKVGDSQRVSFTPHDGILTHTIRWVSYSASIDVSEYIGTTATIKVLAPISVSCVIVQCEYEYIQYIGNFPYYFSAAEDFTIYVDPSDPTNITLQSSLTLNVGDFATLTPTLYPAGAETELSWSSSNSSVASVSASGEVFGGEAGSANITVRTSNGLSATCRVTVRNPVLSLRINPAAGLLEKGSYVTLTAGSNNADIYYTLDGSVPTRNSLVYSSPIPIDRNVTLKAIAYCDGYTQSSVVTADYTVTSLKTVGCYPENNAENVGRNAIPSITFNSEISESDKWNDIKLKNGSTVIPGEKIISGNTLYFVPDEPLEYNKSYTFTLPADAVKTDLNEPNVSYTRSFTMFMPYIVTSVSLNSSSTMAIISDNSLWTWGNNYDGDLGDGTTTARYSPVKVMDDVASAFFSLTSTMAIKTDGSLWAWGDNGDGQLGDGTITDRHSPVKVMGDVVSVFTGGTSTMAIKSDNSLWAWGHNDCGQLGDGTRINKHLPVKVMDDVVSVSLNSSSTMSIKTDGSLWAWGDNSYGRLGDGTRIERHSPVKIMNDVVSVFVHGAFTMSIKTDGSLWAWGNNSYGRLGDGTTTDRYSPVKVMDDVASVSFYNTSIMAIKTDGSLWAWGSNSNGRLGDGTKTDRHSPVKVMDDVASVFTSTYHTMAIKTDGSLWAWGSNSDGRLGDGTTTARYLPVKIMDDVASVSFSNSSTMAIKTDGSLWAWGSNSNGQLGDGTKITRYSPVKIMDDVASVSFKFTSTMAIKSDGSLWSWGSNSHGILGDGTTTARYLPVKVMGGTDLLPIQSIDFDKEKIELRIGSKSVLQTYLQPFNAEYENILWNSTNENVATVSPKGVITAVAPGTTTITATVETEKGADCSASCIVTVSDVSGINAVPYNPLSAWIDNGMLHIKGLKPGNIFSIYDAMGKPVYRGTAESTEINRPIEGKGIFIVKTENCAVKVININ